MLGVTLAVGCLVAVMFEVDGFGSRTGEVRSWYIAALGLGLAASVLIPFVVLRWLMPEAGRHAAAYAIGGLILAFAVFGLSLFR